MQRILLKLIVGTLFLTPLFVSAQATDPLLGPLVPCDGVSCQACDVIKLGNNILQFFVAAAAFIAIIIFTWAGFQMMTAAGDTGKIASARGMFTNVAVGFVIVLAGWLIVDTVMRLAFTGSILDTDTKLGAWNEIKCVALHSNLPPKPAPGPLGPPQPGGGPGGPRGLKGQIQCYPDNPACSVASLIAEGYTKAQADTMSCIAMTESDGIPDGPPSASGARGTFQIIPGNWADPFLHRGQCNVGTPPENLYCNKQTAYLLSKRKLDAKPQRSPYGDWTCPKCNRWAQACVDRYDPQPYPRSVVNI